jgi:hypothetical protein
MKRWMQRNMVALVVAGALSLGLVGPAAAQVVVQDGLVNVTVNNVTILENVNIGVAALIVATICDLQVGPVNVLARSVDRSERGPFSCNAVTGDGPVITILQNNP